MARPFKFTNEQIVDLYKQYNEHMKNQFDIKIDYIKSGDRAGELIEIKKPKIKSIESFCLFIGISYKSFFNWINEESENIDKELFHTITCIREELNEYRRSLALNEIISAPFLMAVDGIKQQYEINSNVQLNSLPVNIANNVIDLTSSDYSIIEPTPELKSIE